MNHEKIYCNGNSAGSLICKLRQIAGITFKKKNTTPYWLILLQLILPWRENIVKDPKIFLLYSIESTLVQLEIQKSIARGISRVELKMQG